MFALPDINTRGIGRIRESYANPRRSFLLLKCEVTSYWNKVGCCYWLCFRALEMALTLILFSGKPKCTIKGPGRKEIPVEVVDNEDDTYDCLFTPEEVGRHNVDVLFGGTPVPGSPFTFKAEKPVDVDKIKCQPKADREPVVDEELVYAVDARPAESAPGDIPDGLLNGVLSTPSGAKEPVRVKDNKDGTYDVACVPKEPGLHELALDYNGVPLNGSPFKFEAVEGGADKVKAYGKGN